jgi:hypothetical protein
VVARPARGGLLVPLLLIFLIPYSLVTTLAVVVLYLKKQEPSLELLPDPNPDQKGGGPVRLKEERVSYDAKVPTKLRVKLHNTVKVGALEVTPQKVEQFADHRLRLVLTMRNRSADIEFNPVSDSFLRFNRDMAALPRPYTFLEIGRSDNIYGGEWRPLRRDRPFAGRLKPGEEMAAWLTTNPLDAGKVKGLNNSSGPLFWRVQVRRGFVEYQGHDVSTTAVIGVEFDFKDVEERKEKT